MRIILGNKVGLLDVPVQRTAAQIHEMIQAPKNRGGGTLHIVAHSQGTEIFYAALNLLTPEEKSMIDYHGYGPEHIVPNDVGLFAIDNVRNKGDGVPIIGNDINPPRRPLGFLLFLYLGTPAGLPINGQHSGENVRYIDVGGGIWGLRHPFVEYYIKDLSPSSLKHR